MHLIMSCYKRWGIQVLTIPCLKVKGDSHSGEQSCYAAPITLPGVYSMDNKDYCSMAKDDIFALIP